MNRHYPQVRNINFRTDEPRWLWNDLYQGWLAIVEIERREKSCRKEKSSLFAILTGQASPSLK